jgi:hypothetical protein
MEYFIRRDNYERHLETAKHKKYLILSYKDTDLSHLTNKDYIGAIKKVSYCVKDMIEKNTFQSIQT